MVAMSRPRWPSAKKAGASVREGPSGAEKETVNQVGPGCSTALHRTVPSAARSWVVRPLPSRVVLAWLPLGRPPRPARTVSGRLVYSRPLGDEMVITAELGSAHTV